MKASYACLSNCPRIKSWEVPPNGSIVGSATILELRGGALDGILRRHSCGLLPTVTQCHESSGTLSPGRSTLVQLHLCHLSDLDNVSFKAMGDILLSGGHLFGSDLLSTVVNRGVPPTRFSLLTMEITLVSTLPKARIVQ